MNDALFFVPLGVWMIAVFVPKFSPLLYIVPPCVVLEVLMEGSGVVSLELLPVVSVVGCTAFPPSSTVFYPFEGCFSMLSYPASRLGVRLASSFFTSLYLSDDRLSSLLFCASKPCVLYVDGANG